MKKFLDLWVAKKGDLFAYKYFEVQAAFLVSVVVITIFIVTNLYSSFISNINDIKNLILYIMQAFIGLLGTILAGLSIMLFLFTSKGLEKIGQKNESGHRMLLSYVFLCLNIVFAICILIILFFVLLMPKPLVSSVWFYVIIFFTLYYIFFILFYTVSLINNAVVLYRIDSKMRFKVGLKEHNEKVFLDIVERIKIYISLNTNNSKLVSFNDIELKVNKILENIEEEKHVKDLLLERILKYFAYLK